MNLGKIAKKILNLLFLLYISSGCAQEPNPVVGPLGEIIGGGSITAGEAIVTNALVFKGSDFFGSSCAFALGLDEHDGEKYILISVDYKLHGETLPDLEAQEKRFDITNNTYSDVGGARGNPALVGAYVKNLDNVDLNQLSRYEQNGTLIYSLRIDLREMNFADYKEALIKVIEDPSSLAAYSSTLNQVERLVFKLGHAGHYDAAGCLGFSASEVKVVSFVLGEGEHDHDHD